mmetsp:Transcript_36037/g.75803  ORF Transcript_36037/g.75803 Transcript_36037/m.75803 type:complete len:205 (+) Transcript_36037:160-774(+)
MHAPPGTAQLWEQTKACKLVSTTYKSDETMPICPSAPRGLSMRECESIDVQSDDQWLHSRVPRRAKSFGFFSGVLTPSSPAARPVRSPSRCSAMKRSHMRTPSRVFCTCSSMLMSSVIFVVKRGPKMTDSARTPMRDDSSAAAASRSKSRSHRSSSRWSIDMECFKTPLMACWFERHWSSACSSLSASTSQLLLLLPRSPGARR